MKRTLLVSIGCLLLGGAFGVAQRKFLVYGEGNSSCGEWTSKRNLAANAAWLVGFVSGAGFVSPAPFKKTDTAGLEAWMDTYCAEHPLVSIADAAGKLVDELSAKR